MSYIYIYANPLKKTMVCILVSFTKHCQAWYRIATHKAAFEHSRHLVVRHGRVHEITCGWKGCRGWVLLLLLLLLRCEVYEQLCLDIFYIWLCEIWERALKSIWLERLQRSSPVVVLGMWRYEHLSMYCKARWCIAKPEAAGTFFLWWQTQSMVGIIWLARRIFSSAMCTIPQCTTKGLHCDANTHIGQIALWPVGAPSPLCSADSTQSFPWGIARLCRWLGRRPSLSSFSYCLG